MLSPNVCLATVTAVAVYVAHVTTAQSSAAVRAICYSVGECHVNGSAAKMCDRTKKECHQCLGERESDSLLVMLQEATEYNCYDVKTNGKCPKGTTKCSAALKMEDEEKEVKREKQREEQQEEQQEEKTSGSAEGDSPYQHLLSNTSSFAEPGSTSSGSDSDEVTRSRTKPKRATSLFLTDSSSNGSATSRQKKLTSEKTTGSIFKGSPSSSGNDSAEDTPSASASGSSGSSPKASSATKKDSVLQNSFGGFDSEEDLSSVGATVAPVVKAPKAQSTIQDTALSEKTTLSTPTFERSSGDDIDYGLILGVVGGATAIAAIVAIVVRRKAKAGEDPDDGAAAFSPNMPVTTRKPTALPSVSSATTSYSAEMDCYGSNDLEYQYDTDHHVNHYGDNFGDRHFPGATATHHTGGKSGGMVPANYGNPFPVDNDDKDDISRRTDSILGGTGVMVSTRSSLYNSFEFTAGTAPSNYAASFATSYATSRATSYASSDATSDAGQDLRYSEDENQLKHGASTASVEF